jgi:redox-sensitive bicupin YhaK (pirin superfamily)
MSNLAAGPEAERSDGHPAAGPVVEEIPGRITDLGGLPIRRLLPRSARRLVGPWCFFDSYGPLTFTGKAMDVAPHPHIGLQTVSWLLEGEVEHKDSLGLRGRAVPGLMNLMTAGRGIAHAEETPKENAGRLRGLQLWIALPEASRETSPGFEQVGFLPKVELEGGEGTVIIGSLDGKESPAPHFSPLVGADLAGGPSGRMLVPLDPDFEHALVLLQGGCSLEGRRLAIDSLVYLGLGRTRVALSCGPSGARLLLLGGAPFGESLFMWWNFVGRTADEILGARDDWEAGRRFGEVASYDGPRLPAPPYIGRRSRP